MSRARPAHPRVLPTPPRALRLVAWVVLTAGVAMSFVGAWRTGVSFDEPYHVLRLQNYFDHGWYLLGDDLASGAPGEWVHDAFVYSPVTALLLHWANVALGNEVLGTVTGSGDAYAVRHLGIAVIGLVGVVATAAMGRLLLRSWAWGLVAAATLVALPMWTGHSMFNIKDVPTATGYTLVTLALMWLARSVPGGWRSRVLVPATLGTGLLLAVGTRPGIWPGLLAAVVGTLAFGWLLGGQRGRAHRWRWAELAAGVLPAGVVLVLVYPSVFADPAWPISSALSSSKYAETGYWWYIPSQVVATMPLLLVMVAGAGWLAALADHGWRVAPDRTSAVRLLLVLCQALLMPALAVVNESHLDTGLRQVLFAAPAVALLLTLGIGHALANAGRSGGRATTLVLGGALAALVVPTVVQASIFPFNYTYVSVIVDAKGLEPLNDSWRTSTRELLPAVPEDRFIVCSPTIVDGVAMRHLGPAGRLAAERTRDCRTDDISPITPFHEYDVADETTVSTTFVGVQTGPHPIGDNCRLLAEVTRVRHFREQRMSAVSECDLVLHPYPGEPVAFSPDGEEVTHLLGNWSGHPAEPGVRLLGRAGSVGFDLDDELAGRGLDVVLDLDADVPVRARVNNVDVTTLPAGRAQHRLRVPGDVVSALGEGRLVVTLVEDATAEGGAVSLLRIALEQEGPA